MVKISKPYKYERRRTKRMPPAPFKDSYGATVRACRRKNGVEKQSSGGMLSIANLLGLFGLKKS